MAKNYNIFISHSWAHSSDLQDLQKLLNSRGYFNVEFTEASKDVGNVSDVLVINNSFNICT